MDIILHSYTFRDRPLEEAFQAAHDFGYDGLELSRVHFDETRLEHELPEAVRLGARYDVAVTCVDFAGDLIHEDAGIVEQSTALIEQSIAICAAHDVPLMNGYVGVLMGEPEEFSNNGSARATDAHYERAAAALRRLGDAAGKHGLRLALEIHMNTIHDTIASMRRLLDMCASNNVVATPDPGNMFATKAEDCDPAALDLLINRIGYFHFKNCRKTDGACDFSVALEEGELDMLPYLNKLNDFGYNYPVCIEHVGAGDPRTLAQTDLAYFRGLLRHGQPPKEKS